MNITMAIFSFTTFLIFAILPAKYCLECNNGEFGCISILRYQGKQYANCLSAAYIIQKSGGKHHCEDPFASYCWYQCMLENHYQGNGKVSQDCSCDNQDLSSTMAPLLPEKCYSPDGRDCSWYRDCLEKKHSCVGETADYAIKFAEKICLLYTDNLKWFSSQGQQWVDGVRKCLQVALVPTVRPYYKGSCADIKKMAFDSHAPCYVNPGFGAPSICDLNCADWFTAFWTIKSSFYTSDAFSTLSGMVEVSSNCKIKALSCGLIGAGTTAALTTPYGRMAALLILLRSDTQNRDKRDTQLSAQINHNQLSAKITDLIANQLKWNHNQMDWFGYTLNKDIEPGQNVSINIWIINKDKNAAEDTVGKEISKFEQWIVSGRNYLRVEMNGVHFNPVSLNLCDNTDCQSYNSTVMAGPPVNSSYRMNNILSVFTLIPLFVVIIYLLLKSIHKIMEICFSITKTINKF